MTSKERLLTALHKGKPDRLPVTIHQWQGYHLQEYMGGMTDLEACKSVGFDAQIQYFQDMGQFWLVDADMTKLNTPTWIDTADIISNEAENRIVHHTIETPGGPLTYKTAGDRKTTWITEYLIKKEDDLRVIDRYMPVPRLQLEPIGRKYDEVGDAGIVRGFVWGDQAGCWQHAACLMDVTHLIEATFDRPGWVHELLRILLRKKLDFIETMQGARFDVIETGGGAASSTLISPALHKEFCLPYDRELHDALHALGFTVSYHTCGGTNGIEEYIVQNHADVSETLAPPGVGGNQEPWEFKAKVGNRIACIGGVDQWNTLTRGSREDITSAVVQLFETVGRDGGYVCSASDHFFETPPENLVAFAAAAKECVY
jgi:uroporphyrinogen decarboxylase